MNTGRLFSLALFLITSTSPASAQQRLQSIQGTVRDADGPLLADADVLLGTRRTSTNPSGQFRIDGLAPGKYQMTVRRIGYRPVRTVVAVVESEPTEVEFLLISAPVLLPPLIVETRRTGIYGVVGDTAFRAAPGAKVEVVGQNGGTVLTDSTGRFGYPRAFHGNYMVRISLPGYAERWFTLEMKNGEGRELVVRLTPGGKPPSPKDDVALFDLHDRLLRARTYNLMGQNELEHFGSQPLCDVPRIRLIISSGKDYTVIVNGNATLSNPPLCTWQMDEIALLEFSSTGSNLPRTAGINRNRSVSTPVIYLWEKR
ncbi:MAG TPA: carboxypeptidase-like regulatory domain-containing protein [Gemmatimonadales bacterium]|nr:carboxypeptidase-like regulatory domain-containing protein [Gemmatimonadales bacterium]